jgi:hypothetical protein
MRTETQSVALAVSAEARVEERFVAAAVHASRTDTTQQLVSRARHLSAADSELASGAGLPFLVFGDEKMRVGVTTEDSGLRVTVAADGKPAACVPARRTLEASLGDRRGAEAVELSDTTEGAGAAVFLRDVPKHIITSSNFGDIERASYTYLTECVLVVGDIAIAAFLAAARGRSPGTTEHELARRAVEALKRGL